MQRKGTDMDKRTIEIINAKNKSFRLIMLMVIGYLGIILAGATYALCRNIDKAGFWF